MGLLLMFGSIAILVGALVVLFRSPKPIETHVGGEVPSDPPVQLPQAE